MENGAVRAAAEGEGENWPTEAAESAFLSEARARGELVTPRPATEQVTEVEPKNLPALDELVNRIPADVRDVLDDLFRAKFVTVRRIPPGALKS